MSEPSKNQDVILTDVLDFFDSQIVDKAARTKKIYHAAIQSLKNFHSSEALAIDAFSNEALSEWAIEQIVRGLKINTLRLYADALSSLYKNALKAGLVFETDAFSLLRNRLNEKNLESAFSLKQAKEILQLIKRPTNIFADILLVALANKAIPVVLVSKLKVKDITGLTTESQIVVPRHIKTGYQYIFPLNQGSKTPRQLQELIETEVSKEFKKIGIPVVGTVDDTVKTLWAYLALMNGAKPGEVEATLGKVPTGLPILKLAESSKDNESLKEDIARLLLSNPLNWYAMKLRRGVSLETVLERARSEGQKIHKTFYPCEEIAVRVGKKKCIESRPVLPDIVFFKSLQSDLLPLFAKIGDLAWCYKYTISGTSRYAIISQGEMNLFQQAIGQFTSDYEVAPLGTFIPQKGETVKIIGGIFTGAEADFENVEQDKEGIIYRLHMTGENGIEWKIKTDSRTVLANNQC